VLEDCFGKFAAVFVNIDKVHRLPAKVKKKMCKFLGVDLTL
jgi:hypothetical protein